MIIIQSQDAPKSILETEKTLKTLSTVLGKNIFKKTQKNQKNTQKNKKTQKNTHKTHTKK